MKAKTATTALNTDHVTGMLQHEKGGVIYYFVPLGAIPGNTAATRNGFLNGRPTLRVSRVLHHAEVSSQTTSNA